MNPALRLALLYTLFALTAMAVNLLTQMAIVAALSGRIWVAVSVLAGTLTGLVAKYALDERFIFSFVAKSRAHRRSVFLLYATLGLVTTACFWGTEFAFDQIWGTAGARYVGGALGLTVGYLVKYRLDKRFVFVTKKDSKEQT